MNSFVSNIKPASLKGKTLTTNGMPTRKSSLDSVADLFFTWGASRNLTPETRLQNFLAAFAADSDLTTRLLLWGRDVRGGAGERNYFREALKHLAINNYELAIRLIPRIAEVGRPDDLFTLVNTPAQTEMFNYYHSQLLANNNLFFKWAPREKSANRSIAHAFRIHLGLSSRQYRKLIVSGTNVVENQMSSRNWSAINYSHVPSRAAKIYSKAFDRNDHTRYQQYLADLTTGTNNAKINASAIFPYDVIQGWRDPINNLRINAQWKALPNYMNNVSVLPMIDVSGSMLCSAGGTSTTCLDVALSLGLYMADKSQGAFKDTFLTFSSNPVLQHVTGKTVVEKLSATSKSSWGMSTNIKRAFDCVLSHALQHNVPESDMPKVIVIFSDMQFDSATDNQSAGKLIKDKYKQAGYNLPAIVYWNINASNGVPVKAHKSGAALVSGFSPSLAKSILTSIEDMTPMGILTKTLSNPRYDY